jgi:hypothetical protein
VVLDPDPNDEDLDPDQAIQFPEMDPTPSEVTAGHPDYVEPGVEYLTPEQGQDLAATMRPLEEGR